MNTIFLKPKSIFFFIILFSSGFVLAYVVFKPHKKALQKGQNVIVKPALIPELLNPLLDDYEKQNLNLYELKNFRPKIDAYIAKKTSQFPDLHISYYFRDLNQGLWIGVNEKEPFSPASLMKIPVMIAILKKAETQADLLDMGIVYDSTTMGQVVEESGIKKVHGKSYSIAELIEMMIEHSDNFATIVLINYIGEAAIQQVEHDLNIFIKPGYSELTNFVSVKTYAGFFRILYNSSYINRSMSQKALEFLSKSIYKQGVRKAIPDSIKVAHKYGKRDIERNGSIESIQLHHFGLVYHPNKPFIIGIMTRGSSLKVKEDILYDLSKITYDEVTNQVLKNKKDQVFVE